MAMCEWCRGEMLTTASRTVEAFHRAGRPIQRVRHGEERDRVSRNTRCGDCGVAPGGAHHPGCDMERCPVCRRQMLTCGCHFEDARLDDDLDDDRRGELGVDGNGCITETRRVGGPLVVVHYDDMPETDVTVVDGIRVTAPLRTVIDLAVSVHPAELESMLRNCLARGLFTIDDDRRRVAGRDMRHRPGASLVLAMVERLGG